MPFSFRAAGFHKITVPYFGGDPQVAVAVAGMMVLVLLCGGGGVAAAVVVIRGRGSCC